MHTWMDQHTAPAVPRMLEATGLSMFLCHLVLVMSAVCRLDGEVGELK